MIVQIPLVLVAIALAIPCLVLLIECLGALAARPRLVASAVLDTNFAADFSMAVLVPAHNESAVITETLAALTPQLAPQDRLIVVADNCTDNTAELARKAGVTVLERTDSDRRGKGYALDCGLRFMAASPPQALVIVDADCQFRSGSLRQLAWQAVACQGPVQAVYLIDKSAQPSLKEAVSAFAFKVKNLVRPMGLTRLGFPCLLTGTGMAFPWAAMAAMDLASDSIVEDMKLGFDLAIAGLPPRLCSGVTVVGPLPPNDEAAETQRTRWEHGHLQLIARYGPQLLGQSLGQGRLDLLAIALDLLIPPLSLLVVLWLGTSLLLTAVAGLSGLWLPALICYAAGTALATAVVLAWANFAQSDLSLKTLLSVPVYILWKIPLYLKFVTEPQVEWIRTRRKLDER